MNNAELIDLFRNVERSNHPVCNGCPMKYTCDKNQITRCLFGTAADALEAAERLLDLNTKRCEALRKQLREANESYDKRIAELERQHGEQLTRNVMLVARLPKEGEWIVEEIDDCGYKWCKWRCSVCREVVQKGWRQTKDGEKPKHKYCPNCGAKMKGENDGES